MNIPHVHLSRTVRWWRGRADKSETCCRCEDGTTRLGHKLHAVYDDATAELEIDEVNDGENIGDFEEDGHSMRVFSLSWGGPCWSAPTMMAYPNICTCEACEVIKRQFARVRA